MSKYPNQYRQRKTYSGKTFTFRSILECNWSHYLDVLQMGGEIQEWDYECRFFDFEDIRHGTTRYKPDFKVIGKDGSVVWHETKGYLDGRSITKIRRMSKYYPEERLWLIFNGIAKTGKQALNINKLRTRVERVVDARPIFKQLGLK